MEILFLFLGIFYGLIVGLVPAAGATTGLITLFGFMPFFASDPYLGVIFCVAVVASLLFLSNFIVPNFYLIGYIDAGYAFSFTCLIYLTYLNYLTYLTNQMNPLK